MALPSFLGKWLSKEPKEGDLSPSHFHEKRRFHRIDLDSHESVYLNLLKPTAAEQGETLKALVTNVSLRGCRLQMEENFKTEGFIAGATFVASLAVEQFPIPLTIEIVRVVGSRELAIKFKPPYPRELERLEKFLEPRCLGMSLRPIKGEFLQGGEKKGTQWFQGVNDTHFFCWSDPETKEIDQQQLIFLQNVVEWGEKFPLRTGRVRTEIQSQQMSYGWVKSELLEFDAVVDKEKLRLAQIVFESASIDPEVREKFLSKLRG